MISTTSFPRAALIGNPSDGYYGKTLAFTFQNFQSDVEITRNDKISIKSETDKLEFPSVVELQTYLQNKHFHKKSSAKPHQLVLATLKLLYSELIPKNILQTHYGFQLQYRSNIPLSVGLAGSTAIIVATFRALLEFYKIHIPKLELIQMALRAETEILEIKAGLQDRVAIVLNRAVFMDFNKQLVEETGNGVYSNVNGLNNLNLYIAYPTKLSESSNIVHHDLNERYYQGDEKVMEVMKSFAKLSDNFLHYLEKNNIAELNKLINHNYDLRKSIIPIRKEFDALVMKLRSFGCSAKFAGSGGGVVGLYPDEKTFMILVEEMKEADIHVFKPELVIGNED